MRIIAGMVKLSILALVVPLLSYLVLGFINFSVIFADVPGGFEIDSVPPAPVVDLRMMARTATSVTLIWTAPGDDAHAGTASIYDIRYAIVEISNVNWDSTTQCIGEPIPSANGSIETFTVTTLSANTTYYFALKTDDEASNWSELSNVAIGTTAPNVPVLSSGTVFPASGDTSTTFTHSVVYTDLENENPVSLTISIDGGTSVNMTAAAGQDGDFTNGEIYEYKTTGESLGLGSHSYQFTANDGVDIAIGDIGLHSGPNVSSLPVSGGGGGGGGGGPPPGVTLVSESIGSNGAFIFDITARSDDRRCLLKIQRGTIGLTKYRRPLSRITMLAVGGQRALPEGWTIIGPVYDIGPDGATFEPSVTLTISYDPELLVEERTEDELYIACWDGSQWLDLESATDVELNTVSTEINHFTEFAVISKPTIPPPPVPPPPPSVAPAPANFLISDLSVTPSEVSPAEPVTIAFLATNNGGSLGSYRVSLNINGTVEQTEMVTLAAGASKTLTYTINKDVAGSYDVQIDALSKTFTVIIPSESSTPAVFSVTNLTISPAEVKEGDIVTILAHVMNSSDLEESYAVTLKIDGNIEQTTQVILAPGENQLISFDVIKDKAGVYYVELGGKSGEFMITPSAPSLSRVFLVSLITAMLVVGTAIGFSKPWLMTRLKFKPRLTMLNNIFNKDEREAWKEYPLQFADELESTQKSVKTKISDPNEREVREEYELQPPDELEETEKLVEAKMEAVLEAEVCKEYQEWLSDQLRKSKNLVEAKIEVLLELAIRKEYQAWLSDQLQKNQRLIEARMQPLLEWAIRKEYQLWLLDKMEESKKVIETKMKTLLEWQIHKNYQIWLSGQLQKGKKPIDTKMKVLFEWQAHKDYQIWLFDQLEASNRPIEAKMRALLDEDLESITH